ncbi:MAG TPA: Ig-like domain-containing protein, partial [Dermatophilaceae bacterium]|nr:Ig-like domain-containing protein [Dermatophilaceae bacterium]
MPLRRSNGAFNCRRALSACATALLVLLGPALGMVAASAVEVPDAVRSVGIVETGSTVYGSMRVELDWMVPDGSRTGDTFTVGLPAKVKAPDGFRFPIKDAAGEVVAWGQVHGSAVVFTLTPYAESHDGVSGAAWLEVKWNQKLVTPGTTEEVVFTVEDKTYRD